MIDRNDMSVEDLHALFGIFTHEIRTGLNAAIGFAHLIAQDERLPGTTKEDATVIKQSAQNTILVCNDYLEIFGQLIDRKNYQDEPVEQINLQAVVERCLIEPVALQIKKQNVEQARQQARFSDGDMDEDELKAIKYVMELMGSSLEAYFRQTQLADVVSTIMPADAVLLALPPTPLRQTLHNLHLLAEGLGGTQRKIMVEPAHDVVELIMEIAVPLRNRHVCEAYIDFFTELEMGLPFERHF